MGAVKSGELGCFLNSDPTEADCTPAGTRRFTVVEASALNNNSLTVYTSNTRIQRFTSKIRIQYFTGIKQ